jgi:hypothetical protein
MPSSDSCNRVKRSHIIQRTPCTIPLHGNIVLRVYADTSPCNLEIARLQKGLVLTLDGRELIEEGVGFGVPVLVFSDRTYFSGSALVSIHVEGVDRVIVKRFVMDTISRKRWKDRFFVDNALYRLFSGSLAGVYRDHRSLGRAIFPLIKLRNVVGIRTHFTEAKPRGEVVMTYRVKRSDVSIRADMTQMNRNGCRKVLLLNEQGANFFRRFMDSSSGVARRRIGAWELIRADRACFSSEDGRLSFCLKRLPGSMLFAGRELIEGRLAWAGMGYELDPGTGSFDYDVEIRTSDGGNSPGE